jgi:putative serine protease PepD
MNRTRLAILIGAIGLAAAGLGVGAYAASKGGGSTTTTTVVQQLDPVSATTTTSLSIHDIYALNHLGVVEITSVQTGGEHGEVEGTGWVYDAAGHVITNYHVVQGTTDTRITFSDQSQYPAKVVAHDASTDLAVLKVGAPASKLHPLTLGDSAKLEVGDPVVAIGSPFGLAESVTNGIVSALNRTISSDNSYSISGAIQTDAAINHGNSGGPLLNMRGRVVGIDSQIESEGGGSDGVGFAISADTVRAVVTQLLRTGKVEHAYIGVAFGPPSSGIGAQIGSVKSGSPAARAGLEVGDVVTSFDGHSITSQNALIGAVNALKPGAKVTIRYERAGRSKTTTVTLGSRP